MSQQFMPHGMCYLWEPELLWTHVISDVLIGGAYFAISLMLAYLVYRSAVEHVDEAEAFRRLPFWWMFLAFGLFIVACGATHFMGVWNVWNPDYWASGGVKVVTAIASVATAIALPPLIPRSMGLLRAARQSEVRKRQLEVANRELAATHARIKELDQLKTEFFANVSHELRTPLALILGPAEKRLAAPDLPAEERRLLEGVRHNARILEKHVDDLLDVTRLEADKLELDRRPVDLARLVQRTAGMFEPTAADRGMDFVIEAPESLEAVVDADAMERVVMNLVSNAIKFTPEGGIVRVRMEAREGRVRFEVRDSGPGVPEELRDAIFERFRQLDGGAARAFGGTGLGLTIAKEFAELHDGSIEVGDAPEGGAAFVVTLPLQSPEAERTDGPAELSPHEPGPPTPIEGTPTGARTTSHEGPTHTIDPGRTAAGSAAEGGNERAPLVLVVEDNEEMGRFLLETLPLEIQGVWAGNGREGLERAEELRPDVVVSDMMMPGMTGEQLLDSLRERPELERTPFLALTARVDDDLKVRLLEKGAQDYLTKPFHPAEVRARVVNWVKVARARELMRHELAGSVEEDLEALAREVANSKRRAQAALEAAEMAREREAAASRAKSDFLAVMSHELRTPLNAIMGYTDLMVRGISGTLTNQQRKHLERVKVSTTHLLSMIEDVLTFARGEANGTDLTVEPVDIPSLIRDLEAIVGGQAREKGLRLEVEQDPEAETLETDRRRLRQILLNLLGNAVKFTDEGAVRLIVARDASRVSFRVEDTGPGIPDEHREWIFEEFWQAEEFTTRSSGGLGLGLTISRRLAREMGGDVTVASREGGGAVLTLVLPDAPAR